MTLTFPTMYPNTVAPITIPSTQKALSSVVVTIRSPYPTVVIVVKAQYIEATYRVVTDS